MNIPSLSIHSTMGKIQIQSTGPQLEVHQGQTQQTIEQPKAEMTIERTPSKLTIDQTQAWNNLNLKSAFVRISEAVDEGHQAVMEGIARRAEEGDDLLHIERGGNPIKAHAVQNAQQKGSYSTGSTPPFQAVKESYSPSEVEINWQTKKPEIAATSEPPSFQFQRGQVNISMAQYPSVDISI
ncbi:hypothetical protein JOD43_004339 [Pullulanibacillus pueri]|uniref:Uncharacterized protein n=1 Tax=Pullulanibacillus pueri TaxID=1437324 RepID=A0A8J3ELK4_9BACL|nr:DUF6470 family protein [Pullulanibacillus pueri]MBM7684126.1 hypothetical protein [Pullulanibacillus pueri]GGH76712.1 hypothetical protein GCM10007096_07550 [Pullulanibacillus pueri]